MNAAQTFLPPPREVRIVIEGAWTPASVQTAANGLIWGQYHAPITEYIFPESGSVNDSVTSRPPGKTW